MAGEGGNEHDGRKNHLSLFRGTISSMAEAAMDSRPEHDGVASSGKYAHQHENPEEAAEHHDLPLAAVAEALLYCVENWDLIQAEREKEWRWLHDAGIIKAEG